MTRETTETRTKTKEIMEIINSSEKFVARVAPHSLKEDASVFSSEGFLRHLIGTINDGRVSIIYSRFPEPALLADELRCLCEKNKVGYEEKIDDLSVIDNLMRYVVRYANIAKRLEAQAK